ncbi:MAG: hypothetical protein R3F42_14830 [Pseudomonadota bacterium]
MISALLFVTQSYAAPAINGVTGVLDNNNSIAISGSGFGTKSTVAPVLWDKVDNIAAYSKLANGASIPVGGANPFDQNEGPNGSGAVKYNTSDPQRGNSTAQYSAANRGVLGGLTWSATDYTYVSWWFKYDRSVSGGDHSSKWIRLSDSSDLTGHTFSWTQMHNYLVGSGTECTLVWATTGNSPNEWLFYEAWFDTAAKKYIVRVNGKIVSNSSWTSSCSYQINELWKIGFDGGGNSPPSMAWWMDDIYVDRSFARVMLGNAPTYSGSDQFEMQVPSAWSASSISVTVNTGAFNSGSTAYLYIVDANGNVNNSGYPVVIGAAGTSQAGGATGGSTTGGSTTGGSTTGGSTTGGSTTGGSTTGGSTTGGSTTGGSTTGGSTTGGSTTGGSSSSQVGAIASSECANPPAGTVFCEDFEGPNPKSNFDDYDGNPDSENQVISDNGPSGDASNSVMRFRVPSGQSGISDVIKVLPGSYDKLYTRWYFKYEAGFDFNAQNHGGGLAAGGRDLVGQSGIQPTGSDRAGFYVQYEAGSAQPFAYSYYRGMYQDCSDPNGSCWGDSLPCVYGSSYCTKPQHLPQATMPSLEAGRWYCVEEMVDMGTPTSSGQAANGRFALWLDSELLGNYSDLWIRTTAALKLENLWLGLYHHDGSHSNVGELIDNVVVSTQPIGCGDGSSVVSPPLPPSGIQ